MKHDPLVSIIIPAYNAEKFLNETVQSVVNQTYNNWELILINDGSIDNTESIINYFVGLDDRIKNITVPSSSGGPAHPRNLGIDAARGEIIAFLDSDDLWAPEKLAEQILFMRDVKADLVHCSGSIINAVGADIGIVNSSKRHRFLQFLFGDTSALMIINPIILSSVLIRKTSILKFREDKDLEAVEDWFLWIETHLLGTRIRKLNRNLMCYRSHGESISKVLNEVQDLRAFKIYTVLLLEKKIGLFRFWVICSVQLLVNLRLRFSRKYTAN